MTPVFYGTNIKAVEIQTKFKTFLLTFKASSKIVLTR